LRRHLALGLACALFAAIFPLAGSANAQVPDAPLAAVRESEPVVLTGKDFAEWSVPADTTAKAPEYQGKACMGNDENPLTGDEWCSHNTYEDPEVSSATATNAAGVTGTPVDQLLGYSWDGSAWKQVPFQVDEMAVRYLSNNNSGFAFYSETDQHTTYVWDREAFRWTEHDPSNPCLAIEPTPAVTGDPVAGLDTDDELAFMARDAGEQAGLDVPLPAGIEDSVEVAVTDPITQTTKFVYVMKAAEDGPAPAFDASNGYVRYERDADANVFLFSQSSYDNYGAAAPGPYFDPATGECVTDEPLQRRPGDQATITTSRYKFRYEGRWLMTGLQVNNNDNGQSIAPDPSAEYGRDVVDQWKARAFQQRPGGETPCCGYEEEVNNWGGSSILMGERYGPVRTIRETWGADSGTNVVRREIFYRDEIRFGAFLRVHVIPPADGIYAQWDYNAGVMTKYYNSILTAQGRTDGVDIDGKDDEVFGNTRMHIASDGVRVENLQEGDPEPIVVGSPGEGCPDLPFNDPTGEIPDDCIDNDIDLPDPTFAGVNAGLNWEEVAGPFGTVVTRTAIKQVTPGGTPQSLLAVPYYRDNACFDDGTGNDPGPHIDGRNEDGDQPSDSNYVDPATGQTLPRECWDTDNAAHPDIPAADPRFYQGSIGTHGVHLLTLAESDNAGATIPLTEIDSEQRVVVLPGDPGNVGEKYGRHSEEPLVVATHPEQRSAAPDASPSPSDSASPSSSPSSADPGGKVPSNAFCDGLDPAACLLPFPNDFFMGVDPITGDRHVNFNPASMPRNGTENTEGGEGKPIDPTEWNRNDGFSPGSIVMTLVPGLDLHETWGTTERDRSQAGINEHGYFDHRDHIADIGLYKNADAPLVIINAETGERHPFWSELDSHPDAVAGGEQLLLMRPAVNFDEGTRYIVALRDLKNGQGEPILPRSTFVAYRDGAGADAARQAHFNDNIFGPLADAGIARDDLYLAWDFTVASEENLAGRMLHMRDVAFELLGDSVLDDQLVQGDAPHFIIDSIEETNGDGSPRTDTWDDSRGQRHSVPMRRVRGRVEVPNFLDRIQQTTAHIEDPDAAPSKEPTGGAAYADAPAPGSRLLDTDLDGLPDQNPAEPTVMVPFVCDVPLNGEKNIPGLYGHGLLGDRDQINDFNKSPRRNGNFLGCAADWWGMSFVDLPTVATILADGSNFPSLPDRAQQGFLNFMILGRAAAHPEGFASDTAFQQDGDSLLKTADDDGTYLVYDGNSQGGIMGGALVAVSPDISRGILGVLGMNYSTLLNRSVDWEGEYDPADAASGMAEAIQKGFEEQNPDPVFDQAEDSIPPYSYPFYNSYRDPVERQIVFSLMQMLWDRGEANGYAHHMTDDPYANTPPHEVMLQAAFSDHQVANVSAEVEARTVGAPLMTPNLDLGRHWALDPFIDTATYPHRGSALIYWDSGNATPPNGNLPPSQGGDPHGHPRDERAASWQEAHFLLTGEMYDVCQGGSYLTKRHPANDGRASCLEPEFAAGTEPPGNDSDGDDVPDDVDNCLTVPNPDQADADGDGTGDACEADSDADGTIDDDDNCPDIANPGQADSDGDGTGDACEADSDGDGAIDDTDNCPDVANADQADADGDGKGDACDPAETTTLTFTSNSAQAGQHSDDARFEAMLVDEQGDPISNATIDFTFTGPGGERATSATTNEQGVADTTIKLIDPRGPAQIRAFYGGSDKIFESSSNAAGFVVELEGTTLNLEHTGKGKTSELIATLVDDDGAPVEGRTVVFRVKGTRICESSAPTNADGVTRCIPPKKDESKKPKEFSAVFDGDEFYSRSVAPEATSNRR
jgi:Thrombospondin type 3 repeat